MMFAAAALAVCTGTAYGQVLDVAPVGDAVMPDGRRGLCHAADDRGGRYYGGPRGVVTGPYARSPRSISG